MGLDMYLDRVKRVENATVRDIRNVNEYLGWCCRGEKYRDSTLKKWCGISEDEVNLDLVPEYIDEYYHRYSSWDTEKKYGFKNIFQNVAYWRKANQIHNWFVNNVQGGEDDCGTYEVPKEQLKELIDVCNRVLSASKLKKGKIKNGRQYKDGKWETVYEDGEYIVDPKIAKELLPTASGFFFGGTEYDEWYIRDLAYTVEALKKILEETDFDKYMIVYCASW